jgi:hypothetical protein
MKIEFTIQQVQEIKALLIDCDDADLVDLFGEVYEFVKIKLAELRSKKKKAEPYQFIQKFRDID